MSFFSKPLLSLNSLYLIDFYCRKEKTKIGPSGGSPSEWPLYRRMHQILGGSKCNNIEEVMEESYTLPGMYKRKDVKYKQQSFLITFIIVENQIEFEILNDVMCDNQPLDDSGLTTATMPEELRSEIEDTPSTSSRSMPIELPARKRSLSSFQSKILSRLDRNDERILQDMERTKATEAKILKIEEEMLEVAKERNIVLRSIAEDNKDFHKAIFNLMKQK